MLTKSIMKFPAKAKQLLLDLPKERQSSRTWQERTLSPNICVFFPLANQKIIIREGRR